MSRHEDFLNTEAVSKITGYHIDTIRRFGRTGKLKMYRSGPESNMKFKRSEVEAFIKKSNPEKTTFETMREIKKLWPGIRNKITATEKNMLLELQNTNLKEHLKAVKTLDKKYNDD